MPEVAEQNYKSAAQFTKVSAEFIAQFLLMLEEYLSNNAKYAPQKELAKWIRNGGGIVSYKIQNPSAKDELKQMLNDEQLGYVEIFGKNEIIIRTDDIEKVRDINRKVNVAKGNYFQEVNATEMEDAIARFDKIKDKDIFTLHDLNNYDVEIIKNKCNNISSGFMVGVTQLDDEDGEKRFNLSIHAPKTLSFEPNSNDFCKSYMNAMCSLYGPSLRTKTAQIDADAAMDKKVAELKGVQGCTYIVGANDKDPKKYIELDDSGFSFYEARVNPQNEIITDRIVTVDIDDINYDAELQRYMDKIFDRSLLTTPEQLSLHLSTDERTASTNRPGRNSTKDFQANRIEEKMVSKINSMIKDNIQNEGLVFNSSEDKFKYYTSEFEKIYNDVSDSVKSGYPVADIEEIRGFFKNTEVEPGEYSRAIKKATSVQHECHKAETIKEAELVNVRSSHGITNR